MSAEPAAPPPIRPWRARFLALTLGLGVAVVPVAGVELRARQLERTAGMELPWDEPGRKYALVRLEEGGQTTLNAEGFHDPEFPRAKPEGTQRVAVMGDSVSYGGGLAVDLVYPRVAQRLLQGRGMGVEVLNFSVFGYDVEQVAATLRYRGWAFDPDLVVYAFFTNDLFPSRLINVGEAQLPAYIGTEITEEDALLSVPLTMTLVRWSAWFRRIQGAAYARNEAARREAREKAGEREAQRAWFLAHFDAMIADAAAHDVPLVVFGLGPHVLWRPDEGFCAEDVDQARFCASQLDQLDWMAERCAERGVPFANAVDWYQASGAGPYFHTNTDDPHHPNADGHAVLGYGLAELTAAWLERGTWAAKAGRAPPRQPVQATLPADAADAPLDGPGPDVGPRGAPTGMVGPPDGAMGPPDGAKGPPK